MGTVDIIAFIFVFLSIVLLIGRTIQMFLLHKINPLIVGAHNHGFNKFIELLLLPSLILWTYQSLILTLKLGFQIFPLIIVEIIFHSIFLQYSGLFLMSIGLLIFLFALISFGNSWRIGIDKKNPGKLITSGIFGFSRNPIFLFMDIFFIGFTLVYPNFFFILFSIISCLAIHYQILQEEKFLLKQYGDEYGIYMKNVKRYI